MTTIDNQADSALSQGRPEQQGCSIRYSPGKEGHWLVTPAGLNVRLGRESSRMPHLHDKSTGPGVFVAYQPEDPGSVALLIDTGATTHVASALRRTRLKIFPGVGIFARAVGGGVSASPGKGTLLIDFFEATGALPTELERFDTRVVNFSVDAIPMPAPTPLSGLPNSTHTLRPYKST